MTITRAKALRGLRDVGAALVITAVLIGIGKLLADRPWVIESVAIILLALWLGGLQFDRADLADRADQATETADRALAEVQRLRDLLVEAPGAGRHSRRGSPR